MLQLLREETKGKLQMLLLPSKNGLDSLFKEVRVFRVISESFFRDNLVSEGSHPVVGVWSGKGNGGPVRGTDGPCNRNRAPL